MYQLSQRLWLQIPRETRLKLAETFGVPRSSINEVVDQVVVSDGFTVTDLNAITTEKMQAFLGSKKTDYFELLYACVDKLEGKGDFAPVEEKREVKEPIVISLASITPMPKDEVKDEVIEPVKASKLYPKKKEVKKEVKKETKKETKKVSKKK
jgi:hypothetical protein